MPRTRSRTRPPRGDPGRSARNDPPRTDLRRELQPGPPPLRPPRLPPHRHERRLPPHGVDRPESGVTRQRFNPSTSGEDGFVLDPGLVFPDWDDEDLLEGRGLAPQ